ncbi:hypothetical protein VCSRO169_3521 [Vibrio cholerae]|nr:hypothetical protein VCSRO169_3521 [Vibrio cholerae]
MISDLLTRFHRANKAIDLCTHGLLIRFSVEAYRFKRIWVCKLACLIKDFSPTTAVCHFELVVQTLTR